MPGLADSLRPHFNEGLYREREPYVDRNANRFDPRRENFNQLG